MPRVTIHHFPSPEAATAFANGLSFVNDSEIADITTEDTTVKFTDAYQDGNLTLDYREYYA